MRYNTFKRGAVAIAAACGAYVGPVFGQECSNSDFKGRYGVQVQVALIPGGPEVKHNWIAGTLVSDGAGVITEYKDTFTVVPPGSDARIVIERDAVATAAEAGEQVTYSVSPDCRIRLRLPLGDVVVETSGVLVNGGREVLDVQVNDPPNSMAGAHFIAVEPAGKEDFASIQEQLDAIKALLDRIAIKNGLRP